MSNKEPDLTEVQVAVGIPWEKSDPVDVVKKTSDGKEDVGTYDDWAKGAAWACNLADRAGLRTLTVLFVQEESMTEIQAYVPDLSKGERLAVSPIVELEFHLNRRGYETQYIGGGNYMVERPDSSPVTDKKRGRMTVLDMLRVANRPGHNVDAELVELFHEHVRTSKYSRYITIPTRGGGSRMPKEEKEKKAQVTAKGTDGKDVVLSPKMQEVLAAVKAAPASAPLGSGEERLDDPTSIAAMKLARDGVVHRAKIGTRWHYFAKEADAKKAEAAQEKAAEAAAAEKNKKAEARAAKAAEKGSDAAAAPAGKRKGGPLKKPSEK